MSFYREQGYQLFESVFDPEEVRYLSMRLRQCVIDNLSGLVPSNVVDQARSLSLDSKDFWALFPAVQYVHKIFPNLIDCLQNERIISGMRKEIGENIKCVQGIYFIKSPGSAGVTWHQDEYYLPSRDKSLIGVWIALDDVDEQNGGLKIIPGSHKEGFLYPMVTQENGRPGVSISECNLSQHILNVKMKAGDVLLFDGYLLHASDYNKTSDRYRDSLVFHCMRAESLFPYKPSENFEGRRKYPDDFRDIVMISGQDPYHSRGIEDIHRAFIQKPNNLYFQS